jgi:AcrR family transcriptional regulator
MTADERRAQLIDSAIALFGRNGFSGTTTKSLALAAGVSEATIFKHFPTKADLYAAAFERRAGVGSAEFVAELEGAADRGDDEELLRRVVKAVLFGYKRDRGLHRMLLFVWLEQDATENTRLSSQIQEYTLLSFLQRFVARRQREGVFAPGPTRLLADALTTLPSQYAIRTNLYGVDSGDTDDEVVEALARFMLAGLRGGLPAAATPRDG